MAKKVKLEIDGVEAEYVRADSIQETVIKIEKGNSVASASVGMKVLVRSRNEGINCGIVEAADETGIILKSARRLWYHRPKDRSVCWYEGISRTGISDTSKVSETVQRKFIIEDYSITECSDDAFESIMNQVPHAQS